MDYKRNCSVALLSPCTIDRRTDQEGQLWGSKSSPSFLMFIQWLPLRSGIWGDGCIETFNFCISIMFISASMYYINNGKGHETKKDS